MNGPSIHNTEEETPMRHSIAFALVLVSGLNASAQIYNKATLNQTSFVSPALALNFGKVYLAWTGTDNQLNVASSSDGRSFSSPSLLREYSNCAPAMVVNGPLFIAWTGTDNRINVMSSSNGTTFGNKVTLNETSYDGPALAAFGGKIYLAWTGTNSNLYVMSSADGGRSFGAKVKLSNTSYAGLALSSNSRTLFVSWSSTSGSLYFRPSLDGVSFGSAVSVGETARAQTGPSMAFTADYSRPSTAVFRHYLAWIGTNHQLRFRYSTDGSTFPAYTSTPIPEWSYVAPAVFQALDSKGNPNGAYIAWTGTNYQLNVARIY
jgi:hypothetical protein